MAETTTSNRATHPITYRGDQVPRHRVIELSLQSPRPFDNPSHEATIIATFTAPSGRQIQWHGFWDGGDEWRVRFSPDEEGEWRYHLHLQDQWGTPVANSDGAFTVTPARNETVFDRHGPVQLASNKRNLVHTDGKPFFWLADTAWNGPLRSTADEWDLYLTTRVRQRFSAVQWVATHWRSSTTDIEGHTSFTGDDEISIVPDFFQRLDHRVESTTAAGLLNAPVMLWAVGHGANPNIDPGYGLPESEAILLARHQVARWAAYPVVWILGGDGRYFGDFAARWRRIGRAVFGDQPHAPVAMHCGGEQWPADELRDEPWMDILGYQSGHGDGEKTLGWMTRGAPATEWNKEPRLFQLNFEPAYENHLGYQSKQPHTPQSVRMAMYWSLLNAPTAGVSYGGHGAWGWDDGTSAPADHPSTGTPLPWRQALTMPAAEQIAHIANLFTHIAWTTLTPAQQLLLDQPGIVDVHRHIMVAANASHDLIVAYTPASGEIRLDSAQVDDVLKARWFDPRTGESQVASGTHVGNGIVFSTPTDEDTDEDWLLILESSH